VEVLDTTRIAYPLAVPSTFKITLWWSPTVSTDCVIATLVGNGCLLEVGYVASTDQMYVRDQNYNWLYLAFECSQGDFVCIGLVQTSTERKLFAGIMGGTPVMASESVAPAGVFTQLTLY
jgi:hypothetical protein